MLSGLCEDVLLPDAVVEEILAGPKRTQPGER